MKMGAIFTSISGTKSVPKFRFQFEAAPRGSSITICPMESSIGSGEYENLFLLIMQALFIDAQAFAGSAKCTVGYSVGGSGKEITFTLGPAITLMDDSGMDPLRVGIEVWKLVCRGRTEESAVAPIQKIFVRIYHLKRARVEMDKTEGGLTVEQARKKAHQLLNILHEAGVSSWDKEIMLTSTKKKSVCMTKVTRETKVRSDFLVGDIETAMNEKSQHVAYSIGIMYVIAGRPLPSKDSVERWFSEDYDKNKNTFQERSDKIFDCFFRQLEKEARGRNRKRKLTIFFHNLGKFDGILLMKFLILFRGEWKLSPLMRDGQVYEIRVVMGNGESLIFRDSLKMLPGSLRKLAMSLCPELGEKGTMDPDSITIENIKERKNELLTYMVQDIYLLGGILKRAQDIIWDNYRVEIVSKRTISALALEIFRKNYYNGRIGLPTPNEDAFIRRGYYGGHVDVYKPKGENLFFYDVNSLYPFAMKNYPMPVGNPTWVTDLSGKDLESLFGFIEAMIVCPDHINKPFLPLRYTDPKTEATKLLFPTGTFSGVYYSEELKFAQTLGYTIRPLSGYIYEKGEGLFVDFVDDLYSKRLTAKKEGGEAMSFVYKTLLNSLYGRFGINSASTITRILNEEEKDGAIEHPGFTDAFQLGKDRWLVSSLNDTNQAQKSSKHPRNAAVQISAAITASARIFMYPSFSSRDDCHYTDTDSVFLSHPLPDHMVDSNEIGKFKLEAKIKEAHFLAPKSYRIKSEEEVVTVKHKGPTRSHVSQNWHIDQYNNLKRKTPVTVKNPFCVSYSEMTITETEKTYHLGISASSKRDRIFNEKGSWIDTKPIRIVHLESENPVLKKLLIELYTSSLKKEEEESQ